MTATLAAESPETTRFDATVEWVDGATVALAESYFYPEGGGQPADRGVIGNAFVEHVEDRNGEIVHHLDAEPAFAVGETVTAQVDEPFRAYCMRAHTASHLLYGAGRRVLDDLGYGGFGIDERKVRVDFETSTDIDDDVLMDLERLVNRAVWDSRPVSWTVLPREEALSLDDIAFNTKTEENVMANSDSVRVVKIGGVAENGVRPSETVDDPWDVAACGGTHVENTREIGGVTVLSRSNPGEGLTRVEFAVGPTGIDHRIAEKRAGYDAARVLGTNLDALPADVERLKTELADAEGELADAQRRLVDARLTDLADAVVERDGHAWLVGTVDGVGPNDLDDRAKALAGDAADVVALVGTDRPSFVVVATTGDPAATTVVDDVTGEFGGGGGGSDTFAQAGGLDAAPDEIVAFLR